jgi:hypothetical protein
MKVGTIQRLRQECALKDTRIAALEAQLARGGVLRDTMLALAKEWRGRADDAGRLSRAILADADPGDYPRPDEDGGL